MTPIIRAPDDLSVSMKTPRRRVLRALATGGLVSTVGCASVVDQTSNAETPSGGDERVTPESGTEVPESSAGDASSTGETETTEDWSTEEVRIDQPPETFSSVPIPSEASAYPRMGVDDAPTVTVLGSWKCPYTRDFVFDQLPAIVDEYVEPGDIGVEFRALAFVNGEPFLGPDAPTTTRAGLSVWETDRDRFWQYLSYVFANQPAERRAWGQPELLVRFGEAAGVAEPDRIERAISQEAFDDRIEQTVAFATSAGVETVPRVFFDGEITAPTVNPGETREQLDRASNQ